MSGRAEAPPETPGRISVPRQRETGTDSIGLRVCTALGLDPTEEATFYMAGWSNGDSEILTASVEVIHQAARRILARLEPVEDTGQANGGGGAVSESREAAPHLSAAS